jgi:hypothetical protein
LGKKHPRAAHKHTSAKSNFLSHFHFSPIFKNILFISLRTGVRGVVKIKDIGKITAGRMGEKERKPGAAAGAGIWY